MRSLAYVLALSMVLSQTGAEQGEVRPEASEPLAVEQAVTLALARNPSILAARKKVEAAEGRLLQARAIPDPEISVEVNGIPSGFTLGAAEEQRIGISQPFEFPGKRDLRTRLGQDALLRAGLELERTQRLVIVEVRKGFYRVLAEEKGLEILRRLRETLEQVQETVIARYRAGSVPYTEINRTRIESGRIQNEIAEAERRLQASRRALLLLLGRSPEHPLRLRGSLTDPQTVQTTLDSVEEALARSLTRRIRELDVASAEKSLGLARMSYYPDFRLGVFYDRLNGPEPIRGWALIGGMSIPLWGFWKQRGNVREAEAVQGEAQVRSEATLRVIRAAAANALSRVAVARAQGENYRTRLLPEAEDALHAGLTQYQYGRIDTLNLLDLSRSYRATHLEAIQAALAYQEALADLSVSGEILE